MRRWSHSWNTFSARATTESYAAVWRRLYSVFECTEHKTRLFLSGHKHRRNITPYIRSYRKILRTVSRSRSRTRLFANRFNYQSVADLRLNDESNQKYRNHINGHRRLSSPPYSAEKYQRNCHAASHTSSSSSLRSRLKEMSIKEPIKMDFRVQNRPKRSLTKGVITATSLNVKILNPIIRTT